jgi:hypothetical protein
MPPENQIQTTQDVFVNPKTVILRATNAKVLKGMQ